MDEATGMFDEVVMADPALSGNVGHNLAYATEVGAGVRKAGYHFRAIGTHATDLVSVADLPGIDTTVAFTRDFHHSLAGKARRIADWIFGTRRGGARGAVRNFLARFMPAAANFAAFREFRKVLSDGVGPRSLLFLPTVDHRYALGLAMYLRQLRPSQAPAVFMIWRYTYFDSLGAKPAHLPVWPRLAFRVLERLNRRYRFCLAVESDRLATEYGWLTQMPIRVIPIPLSDIKAKPSQRERAVLTVVCLGDARAEKGFETLVDALEKLRNMELWRTLRFVIQCNTVSTDNERMVAARLPNLVDPNIHLVHEAMPRPVYEQILVDSDIVLLAYQRSVYWARTSYPFAEAMAAAKPVIVTSNTWMSDQVMRYGSGVVIEGDAQSVVSGLENMVRSYGDYAERARTASERWRQDNNADSLARVLVASLPHRPPDRRGETR